MRSCSEGSSLCARVSTCAPARRHRCSLNECSSAPPLPPQAPAAVFPVPRACRTDPGVNVCAWTGRALGMYQWLDRAPRGRNETGIWWRRHDRVRGLSKSRLSWRKLRDWRLVARGRRGALIAQAAGGRPVAELRRGRTARGFLTAFLLRERARRRCGDPSEHWARASR
jgi:Bacterial protein of unknown function (DUF899)